MTFSLLEINRTLLYRQSLLEREPYISASKWVLRLAGLNAQYSSCPYLSLLARCKDFDEKSSDDSLLSGELIRASLIRGTLHIVTRDQFYEWKEALLPALKRVVNSFFTDILERIKINKLAKITKHALIERKLSRRELGLVLSKFFPKEKPESLAFAARLLLSLVQIPEKIRFIYPKVP